MIQGGSLLVSTTKQVDERECFKKVTHFRTC